MEFRDEFHFVFVLRGNFIVLFKFISLEVFLMFNILVLNGAVVNRSNRSTVKGHLKIAQTSQKMAKVFQMHIKILNNESQFCELLHSYLAL